MVPVLPDPDLVLTRLREGRLDAFINSIEWDQFECKASPYQLQENDQKFELAKDVASMANHMGGVILIGVRTELNEHTKAEWVKEIRSFSRDLVDLKQIEGVIRSWLFPAPSDVEVKWYPSKDGINKGVVAIHVPMQAAVRQPILVARTLDEKGQVRGTVFGFFKRWRDSTNHLTIQEIHGLIKAGERNNILGEKIDALPDRIAKPTSAVEPKPESAIKMAAVLIKDALEEIGLDQSPAYVLHAAPISFLEYKDFFGSHDSPIVKLIGHPPEIRDAGFSIDGGGPPRIFRGHSWRADNKEEHRILELARNGVLTFAAPADGSFLCWNRKQDKQLYRINPIVLTESVYLFSELLRELQLLSEPKNVGVTLHLGLERAKGSGYALNLLPGPVGSASWDSGREGEEAPHSEFSCQTLWARGAINSSIMAYQCISRLYEWFGLTHDKIPYVRKDGEIRTDVEVIKKR